MVTLSCSKQDLLPESQAVNVQPLKPTDPLLTTNGPVVNPILQRAVVASVFCQCVKYVKNVTGVANPVAAKDYGTNLVAAGYYKVTPDFSSSWGNIWASDVIVISNSYGGGVNSTYGHVGFASSLTLIEIKTKGKVTSKYFEVKIKGSNQTNDPAKVFTDGGCNNVDVNMKVLYYPSSSVITFYRK